MTGLYYITVGIIPQSGMILPGVLIEFHTVLVLLFMLIFLTNLVGAYELEQL